MKGSSNRAVVRAIGSARHLQIESEGDLQTITARLSLGGRGLARLLGVSGEQSRFILSSQDGSLSVQVMLSVLTVPEGEQVLGNGTLLLDWSRGTLAHGGRRTTLSRMELRLLAALLEHAPHVVTREQLVSRLWPDHAQQPVRENSLKVWVCQLRRHFVAVGLPEAIHTVRGTGYCLRI